MIIKVCGMRDADNIKEIDEYDVDWIGFIFYPKSSRFVSSLPSYLPQKAKRVGVFVNSTVDEIKTTVTEFGLNIVQLHGNETPDFCKALKDSLADNIHLIKAIPISSPEDLSKTEEFACILNYVLFETRCVTYGGSGNKFDWNILDSYKGSTPFILSGGISPDDANEIKRIQNPKFAGVDLNSKFEISPTIKDSKKIKAFIDELRK